MQIMSLAVIWPQLLLNSFHGLFTDDRDPDLMFCLSAELLTCYSVFVKAALHNVHCLFLSLVKFTLQCLSRIGRHASTTR